MYGLFEKCDYLNTPVECFEYDAAKYNFPIKPHWHYFAEFIYITEGKAELHSDDKTYVLGKGDFIIFHPSAVHSIFPADGPLPKCLVLKFDIGRFTMTPAYAPKLRSIFRYARKNDMRICFDAAEAEKMNCSEVLADCIKEINNYRYGFDIMLQSHIYRLLMSIIRCWLDEGLIIDISHIPPEDSYGIDNITELIDSSINENLKVSDIAEQCGMSYSCFAKKFREHYGMSCKEYIEHMRIYKAEEYLLFTDHDINYISQETGFSDCSHLIKSFRRYRGLTPGQFRNQKQHRT